MVDQPESAETYFDDALAAESENDYASAVAAYDCALRLDPALQIAWYNKGHALFQLGEYRRALSAFERAGELLPDDVDTLFSLGSVHSVLDEPKQALKYYNAALDVDPAHEPAWYNAGCACYTMEKYDQALACFDRALELDPKDYDAWFGKGQVLRTQQEYTRAAKVFEYYLRYEPSNTGAWLERGHALRDGGKYKHALECYTEALRLEPELEEARFYYKKVLGGVQRYQALVKFLLATARRNGGAIVRKHIVQIFISSHKKYSIAEIFRALGHLEANGVLDIREDVFGFDLAALTPAVYNGNVYDFRERAQLSKRERAIMNRLMHYVLTHSEYISRSDLATILGPDFSAREAIALLRRFTSHGEAAIDEYSVSLYI